MRNLVLLVGPVTYLLSRFVLMPVGAPNYWQEGRLFIVGYCSVQPLA